MNDTLASWFIRLLKGIFIGSGFILPGISGGALAAVFGLYERMIMFLANITRDFKANFFFFLPVGIGGVGGVFIFAVFLSFFFEVAEVQLIWFFIGCIVGTLPTLWRKAGAHGRGSNHLAMLILCLFGALAFLDYVSRSVGDAIPLNTYTWVLAGGIIGLSSIVPGLSSSNLLLFLQMYAPLTQGIANLDLGVIVPFLAGAVLTVLLLSRLMAFLFRHAYSMLFHAIIGFVIASTLMIVPVNFDYVGLGGLLCGGAAILGIMLGSWMCGLEDKYK
ncbi:MAG: DUF368 domain-containing protein [Defluviitaleaceae bacterium]|nr:DUF368 domain-containing protein [Defluviitaleaceae bacterium]